MFALNLSEDNRILSAWLILSNGKYDGMPIVDTFPEGNLPDYLYTNGNYVYDPLPLPEVPEEESSTDEVLNTLLGV